MIKRLFFDIGSTLVDESACDGYRLEHMLSQPGAPERRILEAEMQEFARNMLPPYRSALKKYSLEACEWPVWLEKPYPGVAALLEKLHAKYSLGIIANQLPGAEKRLEKYGLMRFFDVIISSAEAGAAKPDPAIFRMALAAADCRPEEAVMIGDRIDNDLIPAAKLGMRTVWVRQGMHRFADLSLCGIIPEYMVADICELTRFL